MDGFSRHPSFVKFLVVSLWIFLLLRCLLCV
uniref:Vip2 protein n=1 Tax=Capsicum annuum TaxID=4072 RepID=Q6RJZ8_CAPAN|nr:Vip2 protein [Capsicum annuum]